MAQMMDIDTVIRSRRSVRAFTDQLVGMDAVRDMLEAGHWAPTATNKQGARFIYVDDESVISKLCGMGTAHFIKKCRQMILVLYDNRIDNTEYHDDVLSGAAAIQNILLKATSLGVGTCWVANLPSKTSLRKLLDIPSNYDPVSLIAFGYPSHEVKEVQRKQKLDGILFHNIFDRVRDNKDKRSTVRLFIRRILRRIYIHLPKNNAILKFAERFEKKFDN